MTPRKKQSVERRKNQRLHMALSSRLKLADGTYLPGKTRNISFGGTFVEFDNVPIVTVGDYFSLRILGRVDFTVKVIHHNMGGIGFQFDFILIKYYEHFKKIMLSNAPDPDRMIKELGRQAERVALTCEKK